MSGSEDSYHGKKLSAREKIKELEHDIREGKKISEVNEPEKNVRIEMLEKVIMAMGSEIKSLNEGHKRFQAIDGKAKSHRRGAGETDESRTR